MFWLLVSNILRKEMVMSCSNPNALQPAVISYAACMRQSKQAYLLEHPDPTLVWESGGSLLTWLALFRLRVLLLGPAAPAARFAAAEPLLHLSPRECPRAAATALPISRAFWTTALATAPAPVLTLAMRRLVLRLLVSLLLMPPPLPPAAERSPRFRCRGWSDRSPPRGSRNRSQAGGVLFMPASRASRARRLAGAADAACKSITCWVRVTSTLRCKWSWLQWQEQWQAQHLPRSLCHGRADHPEAPATEVHPWLLLCENNTES